MNFASDYVYDNIEETDKYEVVSDEEFYAGMDLSDSGESDSEHTYGEVEGRMETDSTKPQPPLPDAERNTSKPAMFDRVLGFFSSSRSHSSSDASAAGPPGGKGRSSKGHHWKLGSKESMSDQGKGPNAKKGKKRCFRRADTNVVSIRFDTLKTPSTMHAGDAIVCSKCEAIMSHISSMEDDGPDKIWKCEFCGNRNLVEIEEEEKPTADDVTYLIEPALSTSSMGTSGRDESIVIFCIDISGSMTVTTEVAGHHELRGSASLRRLRRENTMEGDQHLPRERRNVTYISRLLAVQAAVGHQLEEMAKEFPHRRVGLITFSSEVTVIGDGTGEEIVVSGQKLLDKDELLKVGAELACPKAVKDTRKSLEEKLYKLEEGGATALGPAILIALSMASQHPGSKVILCTDGKSNEGVGKVENLVQSDPEPDEFYESVAESANYKGVSISVITIKGTDCKLIQLGKLADSTQGQVNIVDPLKLTEEFSNVLANRVIATSVAATFILHQGLYIGREENEACKEKRYIGSVNADHEISFEFGVRRKKQKETPKPSALDRISEVSTSLEENPPSFVPGSEHHPAKEGATAEASGSAGNASETGNGAGDDIPSELPFQLQITYTDADGTKALRVLTQRKPVTKDRTVAEKDADLTVLGVHTERLASTLALQGDYTGSRAVALMNQRLGWRSSRDSGNSERRKMYRKVFSRVKTVENTVSARQQAEVRTYGRTHSDDEDDDDLEMGGAVLQAASSPACLPRSLSDVPPPPPDRLGAAHLPPPRPMAKLLKKKKLRSAEVDDDMAHQLFQARSSSTSYASIQKKPSSDDSPKKE